MANTLSDFPKAPKVPKQFERGKNKATFFELRRKSQVNMWSFGICVIVKGACRKCFCCGTLLSAHARSKTSEGGKQRVASPIGTDALLLVLKNFICEHAGGFGQRSRRVLRLRTTLASTVHLRPSWMSGGSVVSAHSARQKKDIYGKPFVHSLFAVAGHFVSAGARQPTHRLEANVLLSCASGMSQGE